MIGLIDLVRGVMHTFFVEYAATAIAGLNLSVATQDQLFLLALFGICNYMTGAIFLLIAFRTRHLVPAMLMFVIGLFILPTIIIKAVLQPTAPLRRGFWTLCLIGCGGVGGAGGASRKNQVTSG